MQSFKKGMLMIFAAVLIFSLAACGGSGSTSGKSSGGSSSKDSGIQKLTIKISHVVAENTPKQQGALAMKKYIEEHSDGKIKVQVYPNGELFGDKDEYTNLQANNVQFIIPDMSKMVGSDPAYNIPSMPFLFKDDKAAETFWDGKEGQDILKNGLKKDGVIGLTMWPNGPKQFTNNKRPIKTPADVKGLKVRTQGGQVLDSIFKTLGAGSTQIPFNDLYTGLEQGTVDAEVNTFSNIESKKFDDVQKYMTTNWGAARVDYALFTNDKFWSSLNDETKKIVQGGVDAGTKKARDMATQLNEEAAQKLKERGKVKIYELTDEERQVFIDALQPVYDQYNDTVGADNIKAAQEANK